MIRACCLLILPLILASCQPAPDSFDILIVNGAIVDGAGNPWFRADVGIRGDKIVFIGKGTASRAKRVIDASNKVVSPGFIDMLGQSEWNLLVDGRALSKISQGITTEITGEGISVAPVNERILRDLQPWMDRYGVKVDWTDLDGYFRRLEAARPAINVATFVGATQVRKYVLGHDNRRPTNEELGHMRNLVRRSMEQGALGVSTSLIYAPASFAGTDELIELAKVAAESGGLYISHIRDEGSRITEAVYEAADIGRAAGIPVEIWHLKTAGKPNWGKMPSIVRLIEQHRSQGLDMTANIYPYPASSTRLNSRIPSWAHEGGMSKLLERLKDPATRSSIRDEMLGLHGGTDNSLASTGAEGILISEVENPELKQYEGKKLGEIAKTWNKQPVDMLLDLVLADSGRVSAVFFSMSEDDVRMAMAQPWVGFCTDSPAHATDGPLSEGKPHPRAYGSFPRILGRYVREANILSLEDAVRKMTSLPAQRVGLKARGLLKEGFFADIVIFDPKTVVDKATFEDPHQYSEGISTVLVNGDIVWENGAFAGKFPGRPLRGPASPR